MEMTRISAAYGHFKDQIGHAGLSKRGKIKPPRESNSLQEDRRIGGVGVRACVCLCTLAQGEGPHRRLEGLEGMMGGGRRKEGSRRGPHGQAKGGQGKFTGGIGEGRASCKHTPEVQKDEDGWAGRNREAVPR